MKSVLIHGLLAVFGLGAAYTTWTRDDASEDAIGDIVIFDCQPQEIEAVTLDSEWRQTRIERRVNAGASPSASLYWATVARKADGKITEPRSFLVGQAWNDHLKRLAPLRAVRALGAIEEGQREKFELDAPKTTLSLTCGKQTHVLYLGGSTYGRGDRYVQPTTGEDVFVVASDIIQHIEGSEFRFKQKQLHTFELSEIDGAKVQARGTTVALVHRNYRDAQRAMWVAATDPDRRNELFDNWFQRVGRLTALEYVPLDAEPGSEQRGSATEATPAVTIEYSLHGKPKGKLEMVRVDVDGKPHYYARTEATKAWVTLPITTAKQVAREAGLVVGLEELEQEPDDPAPETTDDEPSRSALPAGHPPIPSHP